jgi:hypothetical protein
MADSCPLYRNNTVKSKTKLLKLIGQVRGHDILNQRTQFVTQVTEGFIKGLLRLLMGFAEIFHPLLELLKPIVGYFGVLVCDFSR